MCSCVTYHMSDVMFHKSHVTCHMSYVIFRTECWSESVEGLLSTMPTLSSFLVSFLVFEVWKLGGVSRGGSVAVTPNMWQSTIRHVCLSLCFFFVLFFYKNNINFFLLLVLVLLSVIHSFIHSLCFFIEITEMDSLEAISFYLHRLSDSAAPVCGI